MKWTEFIFNVIARNPSEEELKYWCEKLSKMREKN